MIPQMTDGEIVDSPTIDGPVAMNEEPGVWYADPEPMDDDEVKLEAMDQDLNEDEEVVELSSDEELGLYLDSKLEPDSEDEWAAAEDMESEESEPPESSSKELSDDSSKSSDVDWEP